MVTGSSGEEDQIGCRVGEWAFGDGGIDGNALSDSWVQPMVWGGLVVWIPMGSPKIFIRDWDSNRGTRRSDGPKPLNSPNHQLTISLVDGYD